MKCFFMVLRHDIIWLKVLCPCTIFLIPPQSAMSGRHSQQRTVALLMCALLGFASVPRVRADEVHSATEAATRTCFGEESAEVTPRADDAELDEDSDSAPFMIVVEHEDGWHCAASLVSLRTVVTSARCARGRSARLPSELWALAAALLARPVPAPRRCVYPTAHPATNTTPRCHHRRHREARRSHRASWRPAPSRIVDLYSRQSPYILCDWQRGDEDPALDDLAVLELESPFGAGAQARPILMATSRNECEKETTCHAVRAVAGSGPHRARFRVVDAALAAETLCASRVLHWTDIRDRVLCLTGDELCAEDRGTGLVCGGKLCGVLSESVPERVVERATDREVESGAEHAAWGSGCGDAHVVLSVARYRNFLHCAHTLRACGRGDCETLCSEHRLLNGDATSSIETMGTFETDVVTVLAVSNSSMAKILTPSRRMEPLAELRALAEGQAQFSARPVLEFEPNRADFRVLFKTPN
ncbi:unnamed protein product [Parnassius apollo]|uniref:(apollo) hypothetical protein n=1 Tax=Parnassius apollo TaxID=110799 RepID=A0A8S3WG31_PARAO|nr:unnamed protein product [Parnassius apollo]